MNHISWSDGLYVTFCLQFQMQSSGIAFYLFVLSEFQFLVCPRKGCISKPRESWRSFPCNWPSETAPG